MFMFKLAATGEPREYFDYLMLYIGIIHKLNRLVREGAGSLANRLGYTPINVTPPAGFQIPTFPPVN